MESNKIRAILMRPGKEAQKIYICPKNIYKVVGSNYNTYYPLNNSIAILYRSPYVNRIQRANRSIKINNINSKIMYGDILAVGSDIETKEFRSLTDDEVMECMIEYRIPEFQDYVFYGLKPGDKIDIHQKVDYKNRIEKYWQEKRPEVIKVVKEYKYFISCEGIWNNGNTKIRFSINKPLDNDYIYKNLYTGEIYH